jgi:hypothetical protein
VVVTQFFRLKRRRTALHTIGFNVPASPDFNWITRHNSHPLPQNKNAAGCPTSRGFRDLGLPPRWIFLVFYLYIHYFKSGEGNGQVSEKYICPRLSKLERKPAIQPLDNIFADAHAPNSHIPK